MPGHPGHPRPVVHLFVRLVKSEEILHPWVGVVLSGKELGMFRIFRRVPRLEASRLVVGYRMLGAIPAPKAEVNASYECHVMVDDAYLFVVSEEELVLLELIRRSLNEDIWMQIQERELGVFGIDGNSRLNVPIYDDKDLDTFPGLPLEQAVEAPFLADASRSSHVQLRTEPPVVDINYIPGHVDGSRDIPHVVPAVHEPLGVHACSDGSKAPEAIPDVPGSLLEHFGDGVFKLLDEILIPREKLDLALRRENFQRMMLLRREISGEIHIFLGFGSLGTDLLALIFLRNDHEFGVDEVYIIDVHVLRRLDAHNIALPNQEPLATVSSNHLARGQDASEVQAFRGLDMKVALLSRDSYLRQRAGPRELKARGSDKGDCCPRGT